MIQIYSIEITFLHISNGYFLHWERMMGVNWLLGLSLKITCQ